LYHLPRKVGQRARISKDELKGTKDSHNKGEIRSEERGEEEKE
jgi:hypothetical protein